MKLKKLSLDNFAKFTKFECEFDGKVTHLVGVNGAGKTTVGLTAIWACLKGIAEKSKNGQLIGERFRFIGSEKRTAEIELLLLDETKNVEIKVKNVISESGNKISFDAPPHYQISQAWLNNLLSMAFLSTKNFTQLTSKEQALLLGIDTKEFDNQIKELKEQYTYINRELKGIGDVIPVEKIEPVSLADLLREKQVIEITNDAANLHNEKIKNTTRHIENLTERRTKLLDELDDIDKCIKNNQVVLTGLGNEESLHSLNDIIDKIANAEETNKKANEYREYIDKLSKQKLKEKELEENKEKQKKVQEKRIQYITSFDAKIEGIDIDSEGALMLDGRPIKEPYFSKGELEITVAKLYASINPELKIRFIDDFEVLDKSNQEKILNQLLGDGFQVITAEVGEQSEKENTILLRECKAV